MITLYDPIGELRAWWNDRHRRREARTDDAAEQLRRFIDSRRPQFTCKDLADRLDRIEALLDATAIENAAECADITVTVREADGTEAPLRRLARCLDGAGLIDHEGI